MAFLNQINATYYSNIGFQEKRQFLVPKLAFLNQINAILTEKTIATMVFNAKNANFLTRKMAKIVKK
jgi:hypothetical protein